MDQRERGVAAENRPALARPVRRRARARGIPPPTIAATPSAMQIEENAQAREPAAQIAQREAREGEARARRAAGESALAHAPAGRERLEDARTHAQRSVAARGEGGIMGDERQRRAAPRGQIEQQIDDRAPGGLVEIARRLVGDQQRWPRRTAPGPARRAAARRQKAARDNGSCRSASPTSAEFLAGPARGVWRASEFQRRGDVLERSHGRDQMEGLEDDADRARPESAPGRPRSRTPRRRRRSRRRLSGRSSPAMIISSVDLPEPEAPTMPTASPLRDCQTDVAQDMHAGRASAEAEVDAAHRDRRKDHRAKSLKRGRTHMAHSRASSMR